jgi:hypothetical protein
VGKAFAILAVSFLNLVGAFFALATLGGLGEWSNWQFFGLFGFIEAGMGLAFIVGLNIWRLRVSQANTKRTVDVRLAPDVLLIPQWGSAAKVVAGLAMLAGAGFAEGWSLASLALIPGMLLMAAVVLAISLVVARAGVARPDLDVVSLVIKRPLHEDRELPAISLGGVLLQLVTQIGIFPLVKGASPTILYQPGIVPSMSLLVTLGITAAFLVALAALLWRARIDIHAPREQQLEVDRELSS